VKILGRAGRDIGVGVVSEGSTKWTWLYDTASAGDGGYDEGNSFTSPTSISDHTDNTKRFSIYATYTAAAELAVTTQAVSDITGETTATGNGNITDLGDDADADKRGFVYDYITHGDPGDTAPAVSDYAKYVEDTNSFGTGAFTKTLIDLWRGAKIYVRAYAHNSAGYAFGGEVSLFTPGGYAVLFQEPAIV